MSDTRRGASRKSDSEPPKILELPDEYRCPKCQQIMWSGGPPTSSEFPFRSRCGKTIRLKQFLVPAGGPA